MGAHRLRKQSSPLAGVRSKSGSRSPADSARGAKGKKLMLAFCSHQLDPASIMRQMNRLGSRARAPLRAKASLIRAEQLFLARLLPGGRKLAERAGSSGQLGAVRPEDARGANCLATLIKHTLGVVRSKWRAQFDRLGALVAVGALVVVVVVVVAVVVVVVVVVVGVLAVGSFAWRSRAWYEVPTVLLSVK